MWRTYHGDDSILIKSSVVMFNFSGVQLLSPLLRDPEEFPQIRFVIFPLKVISQPQSIHELVNL